MLDGVNRLNRMCWIWSQLFREKQNINEEKTLEKLYLIKNFPKKLDRIGRPICDHPRGPDSWDFVQRSQRTLSLHLPTFRECFRPMWLVYQYIKTFYVHFIMKMGKPYVKKGKKLCFQLFIRISGRHLRLIFNDVKLSNWPLLRFADLGTSIAILPRHPTHFVDQHHGVLSTLHGTMNSENLLRILRVGKSVSTIVWTLFVRAHDVCSPIGATTCIHLKFCNNNGPYYYESHHFLLR